MEFLSISQPSGQRCHFLLLCLVLAHVLNLSGPLLDWSDSLSQIMGPVLLTDLGTLPLEQPLNSLETMAEQSWAPKECFPY